MHGEWFFNFNMHPETGPRHSQKNISGHRNNQNFDCLFWEHKKWYNDLGRRSIEGFDLGGVSFGIIIWVFLFTHPPSLGELQKFLVLSPPPPTLNLLSSILSRIIKENFPDFIGVLDKMPIVMVL